MSDLPSNTETELKLTLHPKHLARLRRSDLLRSGGHGRPTTRTLESVYFDTADFRLRDRRVTLRVRKQGTRFIQTVKTAGDGLHRGEWEWPVAGGDPDLTVIQDPEVWTELGPLSASELRPVFLTHVRRSTYRVREDAVEVAVDTGEIRVAGGAAEPVAEVELELKNGEVGALFDLAIALAEQLPLQVEPRSKAERGFALAAGGACGSRKAARLILAAEDTAEDVLVAILRGCLTHLGENQACALAGTDPEGIHQMRVALRRLRSALALFKKVIPADQLAARVDDLRWLGSALGPARDWDVFVTELLAPVRAAFAGQPGFAADLEALAQAAEKQRAKANEAARTAILSSRYTLLHLEFGRWIEERAWRRQHVNEQSSRLFRPIPAYAERLLKQRGKRARRLGADLAHKSAEERHQLRIALKKLRYAGEFFRSLWDEKDTKPYLQQLAALQDVLGHLNDVATATRLLDPLAGGPQGAVARGAGLVCGWHGRGAVTLEPRLLEAWDAFRGLRPFWTRDAG